MNTCKKLKELNSAEVDAVSGGLKWDKARPSTNVFTQQKGQSYAMNQYMCVPLTGYRP